MSRGAAEGSRTRRSPVQDFVEQALPLLGGLVEPGPNGSLTAVLPPGLTGDATESVTELVFDPDHAPPTAAHGGRPGADGPLLVTIGSSFLEELLQRTAETGLAARWFVNGLSWSHRPGDRCDPERWGVRLADVRVERLDRFARVVASHYLVCTVLVALISDDKQELLETVVVETRTGHPAPLEWERWRRLRLDPRPVFDAEGRDTLPGPGDLEHAWQYAVVRVERQLAKTLASHTRQAAVRRDVEEARARSYFEENEADLRRRLERAQASADTTPEVAHRAAALAQKLAANQAEWERRQADIAAKHRLMVRLTLLNAGLITQPKLVARVRVGNPYASAMWPLTYDPLTDELELPACASCDELVETITVCAGSGAGPAGRATSAAGEGGHLLCPRCAVGCVACRRRFCPRCAAEAMAPCAVCHRSVCRHSRVTCRRCGAETCPEHRGACHATAPARAPAAPAATAATVPEVGGPAAPAPPPAQADAIRALTRGRRERARAGGRTAPAAGSRSGAGRQGAGRQMATAIQPSERKRLSRGDRLRLAGRLYGRLGEFARGPACAAAYQAAFKQAFKNQAREPASWQRTGFDEWFMFEGGSAQGRTIGLFAMMHRDLAEEELALLGAWLRTPRRQYRVAAVGTGTVDLVEVAGRERRTVREAYRLPLPYLEVGDVIDARVLPAGGESSFLSEACFFGDRR